MKNAVIFDLDGTLLNTLDDLATSANFALSECGLPPRTIGEVRAFLGNGIRYLIDCCVPENTPCEITDKCFAIFKQHYSVHSLDKTAPYAGVLDLLRTLKAKGYKMAIVSNKFQQGVTTLNQTLFESIVEVAIGEREGMKAKPAPDLVNLALSECNIQKENAIYVGDSEVDIATAQNSGLDMVAVTWGFRDKEYLVSCGAKVFIDKPCELVEILEKL